MLHSRCLLTLGIGIVMPALLLSCSGQEASAPDASVSDDAAQESASETALPTASDTGTLEVRANGEDFVRQGFTSKDGWQIQFDHVYVTLSEVMAYQGSPPDLSADKAAADTALAVSQATDELMTVDLAASAAEPRPLVKAVSAPAGRYAGLSWSMVPATAGPAEATSLMLQGTAEKDGQAVDFQLKLDPTLTFVCGDYVGEERKGILAANDTAELEMTFHFDHLFGNGDAPGDDLNAGALGFDPLAAIASEGTLVATQADLQTQLSPDSYQQLLGLLPSLGHVGEGHCDETTLTKPG